MRRVLLLLSFATALGGAAPTAEALSIGRSTAFSALGRPLDLVVAVQLAGNEVLRADCVVAVVTVGDRRLPAAAVRAGVEASGDRRRPRVRVTTTTPIEEPVVAVDLAVGCGARVSRRIVTLIDPSRIAQGDRRPAQSGAADAPRSDPGTARARLRVDRPTGAAGAESARSPVAAAPAVPSPSPTSPGSPGSPVAPTLSSAPPPSMSSTPPIDPASSGTATTDAGPGIQAMVDELARLRAEFAAQRQTVSALQARLRQAETERFPIAVVAALVGLAMLFALLAAALWWLRPRRRRPVRPELRAGESGLVGPPRAGESSRPDRTEAAAGASTAAAWEPRTSSLLPSAPGSIGGLEVTTVHSPPPIVAASAGGASSADDDPGDAPVGDVSMEELIDIEQQLEFFAVLGQDEAAIDLLAGCLARGTDAGPWPHLQMLEIQKRHGDEAGYERTRDDYRERFAAEAPGWEADLLAGRSLEAHPRTIARLQALWPTPLHAMKNLAALLVRRDPTTELFDLPACRELLFLYALARELAENVETDFGSIDLFLPLEEPGASRILQSGEADRFDGAVDFDVSSWQDESVAPRRSAG